MIVALNADGGARGNHEVAAPSTCGAVLTLPNGTLSIARRIHDSTNNVAEYMALIMALERLTVLHGQIEVLTLRGDSQLVLKQSKGEWKVKQEHLLPLRRRVQELVAFLGAGSTIYEWVPRELNQEADALANQAYLYEIGETREWWTPAK